MKKIQYTKFLALSLLTLGVIGLFPNQTLAADSKISIVGGGVSDTSVSGTSTYNASVDTTSSILTGSVITLAITDVAPTSSSTTVTSTASFADASLGGMLSSSLSIGASAQPSQIVLDVTSDIAPSTAMTFSLSGIHMPTVSGCYYLAMTTDTTPTAATNWQYGTVFEVGLTPGYCTTDHSNDGGGGEVDNGGGGGDGGVPDLPLGGTVSGTSATLTWSSAGADTYALMYDTNSTTLQTRQQAFGSGDTSVADITGITGTSASVSGLLPNTLYYFSVAGVSGGSTTAYTQTSFSLTTGVESVNSYTLMQKVLIPKSGKKAAKGKSVQYQITVKNTGNTTLTKIPLEAKYSKAYMKFVSSNKKTKDKKNDGTINWKNVAPSGGLLPGKSVKVTIKYVVTKVPKTVSKRKMKHTFAAKSVKNNLLETLSTVSSVNKKVILK